MELFVVLHHVKTFPENQVFTHYRTALLSPSGAEADQSDCVCSGVRSFPGGHIAIPGRTKHLTLPGRYVNCVVSRNFSLPFSLHICLQTSSKLVDTGATQTMQLSILVRILSEAALIFSVTAPERLLGNAFGPAFDWWSFGCLVYEMATGLVGSWFRGGICRLC